MQFVIFMQSILPTKSLMALTVETFWKISYLGPKGDVAKVKKNFLHA